MLAQALREGGYAASVFDCQFEDYDSFARHLDQRAVASQSQVLAFSIMHASVPIAVILASLAKHLLGNRVTTVVGGSGAFGVEEALERFGCFDIVTSNPRPELLVSITSSLATPIAPSRSTDSVYSVLGQHKYDHFTVSASKGCVGSCAFCSVAAYWGRHEARQAATVHRDLEWCYSHGHRIVDFVDDTFFVDRPSASALVDILASYRDLRWRCFGRADFMDEASLERIAEAGCSVIYYGMESGSQRILDTLRKRLRVEDAKRIARASAGVIPCVYLSYMWGYPDESIEEFYETIMDMQEMVAWCPNVVYQLNPIRAYPGTRLHRRWAKRIRFLPGELDAYRSYYSRCLSPGKAAEAIDIVASNPDVFTGFGYVPSPDFERKQALVETLVSSIS